MGWKATPFTEPAWPGSLYAMRSARVPNVNEAVCGARGDLGALRDQLHGADLHSCGAPRKTPAMAESWWRGRGEGRGGGERGEGRWGMGRGRGERERERGEGRGKRGEGRGERGERSGAIARNACLTLAQRSSRTALRPSSGSLSLAFESSEVPSGRGSGPSRGPDVQ